LALAAEAQPWPAPWADGRMYRSNTGESGAQRPATRISARVRPDNQREVAPRSSMTD
jgi:hypothetical protein